MAIDSRRCLIIFWSTSVTRASSSGGFSAVRSSMSRFFSAEDQADRAGARLVAGLHGGDLRGFDGVANHGSSGFRETRKHSRARGLLTGLTLPQAASSDGRLATSFTHQGVPAAMADAATRLRPKARRAYWCWRTEA